MSNQTRAFYTQSPNESPPRRSCALHGFGIAEIVFSVFLFSSCMWIASADNELYIAYIGFACAALHFVLGIVAVIGGHNVDRYRGCVITTLVLGVIGSCVFVVATLAAGGTQWSDHNIRCANIKNYPDFQRGCFLVGTKIYLPIVLFALTESVVGIVLSGIACSNLCRCCNGNNDTRVRQAHDNHAFQSPRGYPHYEMSDTPQQSIVYPPPDYIDEVNPTPTAHIASIHRLHYRK